MGMLTTGGSLRQISRDYQDCLRTSGHSVTLEEITSAYVRPHDFRLLTEFGEPEPDASVRSHAIRLEDALLCWTELTSALVVNPTSAIARTPRNLASQNSLARSELMCPKTLITTGKNAALEFREKHGSIIYKSVSGVRNIVSRFGSGHRGRLQDITNCSTQFQQYIAGRDYRPHLVGGEFFVSEIISDADDYRYAIETGCSLDIRPAPCHRIWLTMPGFGRFLGLHFSGVDLRRNQDGKWFCFEVNPSPGFSFYEEATGQPISDAVASLPMNSC
jgi:glutathione synthase/RimK-type ligase-like ATP-grasp enzyme